MGQARIENNLFIIYYRHRNLLFSNTPICRARLRSTLDITLRPINCPLTTGRVHPAKLADPACQRWSAHRDRAEHPAGISGGCVSAVHHWRGSNHGGLPSSGTHGGSCCSPRPTVDRPSAVDPPSAAATATANGIDRCVVNPYTKAVTEPLSSSLVPNRLHSGRVSCAGTAICELS